MAKYKRFDIALERLSQEYDIQHMIALNRVSRLLNKTSMVSRQRTAVNFSRKFVISDYDVRNEGPSTAVIPDDAS